uniref:Uncharacterized protein n=1 Tax=Arundo donax TaxID=35708 RepID=A0A0A9CJX4_ARUDO
MLPSLITPLAPFSGNRSLSACLTSTSADDRGESGALQSANTEPLPHHAFSTPLVFNLSPNPVSGSAKIPVSTLAESGIPFSSFLNCPKATPFSLPTTFFLLFFFSDTEGIATDGGGAGVMSFTGMAGHIHHSGSTLCRFRAWLMLH